MDARRFRRDRKRMTGMTGMKKLTGILVLLLAAALLTGCGQSPSGTAQPAGQAAETAAAPAPEAAQAQTLEERIGAIAADAGDLAPFSLEELADMTGIAPEDCADFVFLQGDGTDGREILAVTVKNAEAGDRVEALMQSYLERRRDENRNYAPAAYQLLSKASVVRKGLTLVMISGTKAAEETERLLAGE